MKINRSSQASIEFDITRPLHLTRGPILGAPKDGSKAIYIYSTALDGVNPLRVATVAFGLDVGLSDEQEEALMERIADAFVAVTDFYTPVEVSMDLIEAAQMSAGVEPNSWRDDEEFLEAGTGELWEVRVISSADDMEWCDFQVRAETMEDAAAKAELVARRNSDMYFGETEPYYYADRQNISRLGDDGEEPEYWEAS